ncbi:MAG: hypothetical protein ACKVQU_14025 [Burkholderiales bacterium]
MRTEQVDIDWVRRFILFTGMRILELLRLRVKDVEFTRYDLHACAQSRRAWGGESARSRRTSHRLVSADGPCSLPHAAIFSLYAASHFAPRARSASRISPCAVGSAVLTSVPRWDCM